MIVQCSKCGKKYKIDPAKVTEKGVKFSCQSCGNVMVIKKRAEDKPKEDSTPCSICGQPATQALDTPNPLCDRCLEIEQEKASRFQEFTRDEGTPPPHLRREIELDSSQDVSFENLSGGDFAPPAYSTEVLPGETKTPSVEEDKKKEQKMSHPKVESQRDITTKEKTPQPLPEKKTVKSDKEEKNVASISPIPKNRIPAQPGTSSSLREKSREKIEKDVLVIRKLSEIKEDEKELLQGGAQFVEISSGEGLPQEQSSFPMFLSLLLLITLLLYYIIKFVL